MGVTNAVADYMGELLGSCGSSNKRKKKRAVQSAVVELKVRMCCDGCELKVHNALSSMQRVDRVDINRKQQKVTVVGKGIEAGKVLKKAKGTGKKSELWPYVPYTLLSHLPYIPLEAYDKKAPPGYVRNVQQFNVSSSSSGGGGSSKLLQLQDEQYTVLFGDENPNSCSIM